MPAPADMQDALCAGFVRLAVEQNARLVPVVVFGEVDALRNFISWPWLQQWSYKKLGFPVPYLVVGRWGVSPFPRRTGLKFVIGEPIQLPHHISGTQASCLLAISVALGGTQAGCWQAAACKPALL